MLLKKNIPFRYIFGKIQYELLVILIYTTIIALLHEFDKVLPISIPLAIPALLGTVISLLLGFRSNQAYDRWWEARHIWGAIVNESRTLARQILTFTDIAEEGDDVHYFRDRVIRRQIAWCYSLGQGLRGISARQGLDKYLSKREMEALGHYTNVPAALLEQHGRDLKRALENGWINRYQQVELDRTVTRLCDAMGKCERIKNTVFPHTYSLYIHFSLLLFIALLPFGVIEYFGFLEIPLVMAVSASFLLIEKMAIHLQDPFENKPTDTPMTTIARNIERDLRQMIRDQEMPEQEFERPARAFYVL
ncbi:bestrophin family ion channel [Paraflavitalea sp. CAU 1676]|uniref:bestrophin family protein n=1 Tax=Paraflavitalea sp. CAU 1676 TaxID=3032598 RepID=UPI0023DAE79C|nr:bestrophin family ion channel [Paraflavitalea sp. CAU 1676]MDF2188964.1 bestrophin family ion channel [Paraflavitalea sp. CAU 1676]